MTDAPKLRLPRYTLRTLLLVVTVVAVFLGYHVNWIRQRHILFAEEIAKRRERNIHFPVEDESQEIHAAPGLLPLFGEKGTRLFHVVVDSQEIDRLSKSDLDRVRLARKLFPEVYVGVIGFFDVRKDGTLDLISGPATQLNPVENETEDN